MKCFDFCQKNSALLKNDKDTKWLVRAVYSFFFLVLFLIFDIVRLHDAYKKSTVKTPKKKKNSKKNRKLEKSIINQIRDSDNATKGLEKKCRGTIPTAK